MVDKMNKDENNGAYPWQSEFISVHYNKFSNSWSLCAFMSIRPENGYCVPFEDIKHETFQEALNAAVDQALIHSCHVVVCSDPETGRDLQPSRVTDSQNVNGVFIAG